MAERIVWESQSYAGSVQRVVALDDPSFGGASHRYQIQVIGGGSVIVSTFAFQEGAVKDVGLNGIQHDGLVAILIDRLRGFQAGPNGCRENAIQLTKLEEVLMWIEARNRDRQHRGVEGTTQK